MKQLIYLGISFLLLLSLSSLVLAQEVAKYNFGSAQSTSELSVSPGQDISTKIYFYNVFGNKITHISLSVSQVAGNWKIEIEPALHTTIVNVSGIMINVTESLYVEPSQALESKPSTAPEGIEYISSSVGWLPAKPVKITISVPKDAELGKEFNITISAVAEWLGQTGTVAVRQSRDFKYTVKTVAKEFEEKIVPAPFSKSIRHRLNITEEAVRAGIINNTKLLAALEKALATPMDEHAIANLAKLTEAISRDVEIDRELSYQEGVSTLSVKIKYTGDKKAKDFTVYDVIPKAFAESTDEITVKTKGKVEIVEKDPSYLITYPEVYPNQEVEINYTVNKAVSSTVLDEVGPPVLYTKSLEKISPAERLVRNITGFITANTAVAIGIAILIILTIILPPKFRKKKLKYRYKRK